MLRRDGNIAWIEDQVDETSQAMRPGLAEAEVAMLRTALEDANGNLARAARALGITCPKLAYRIRKYGIS